jgi:NADH-quinone oxidoreductase subunit M
VLFGAWKANLGYAHQFVVAAAWGALIIGAVYMLRAVRSVLHGEPNEKWSGAQDANAWRKLPFALLLGALILFGVFPGILANKIKPGVENIVTLAGGKAQTAPAAKRVAAGPTR